MVKFLLWCLLFFFCWPLALLALIAYPLVWLILLPFEFWGLRWRVFWSWWRGLFCCPGSYCGLSKLAISRSEFMNLR